jgi:hypothetical protein
VIVVGGGAVLRDDLVLGLIGLFGFFCWFGH